MELIVSPHITNPPPDGLGFPYRRITKVIAKPSQRHTIVVGDFVGHIVTKPRRDHVELVVFCRRDPKLIVNLACRVFPDLAETPIADMSPLELLKAFVERFGVRLGVGDDVAKFHLTEAASIQSEQTGSKLFSIVNPSIGDRALICSMLYTAAPGRLAVAMAFAVHIARYNEWAAGR